MKGNYILAIAVLLLMLVPALTGCDPGKDTASVPDGDTGNAPAAFDSLWTDAPKGTLAIIINLPSAKQLSEFSSSEKLILEETEENLLLIPAANVDSITIWSMEFADGDFRQKEAVYVNRDIAENFVLDLTAMRPEGGPHFQISLKSDSGMSNYFITYNGKDGNPNIEYITEELDK